MWLFFHSEKVIASTIIDFIVNNHVGSFGELCNVNTCMT